MNKKTNKKLIRKNLLNFAGLLNQKIGESNYDINIKNNIASKVKMGCWVWLAQKVKVDITTGVYYVLIGELKEKLIKNVDSNSQ
jgi:hypothetical protein